MITGGNCQGFQQVSNKGDRIRDHLKTKPHLRDQLLVEKRQSIHIGSRIHEPRSTLISIFAYRLPTLLIQRVDLQDLPSHILRISCLAKPASLTGPNKIRKAAYVRTKSRNHTHERLNGTPNIVGPRRMNSKIYIWIQQPDIRAVSGEDDSRAL